MGLSLAFYQYIKDQIQLSLIGDGKYGKVYKLKGERARNGKELTVERVDKQSFKAEVNYGKKLETEFRDLLLLEHRNLLQFFHMNRMVTSWWYDPRELRYEYLENGTNLQRYLSEPQELDWQTCYGIIKGICDGLAYLHTRQKDPIYHLDISPRCIMLDKYMTPKLQYVSLSKFLYPAITWKKDKTPDHGTPGYRPPEYLQEGIVSEKFDVFGLGIVMINILTGVLTGYEQICKVAPEKIIDLAQKNWRKIVEDKRTGISQLELYCQQVTKCTKIALSCLERDMNDRPNVTEIIKRLNEPDDPRSKILQRLQELLSDSEDSTSRGDSISNQLNSLERGEEPINLDLPLLQLITANFSDELKVGHGGCGAVYKGILPHRTIAVKKLFNSHTIDDKMFHQEVTSLMLVRHQNIVRFLGHCSHTEELPVEIMPGKFIMAEERKRMLCFEYISNGSLEGHITDELRGLEWNKRYQIIKGICDGLCHLHVEKHIIHMDLKPANILLDDSMVPKITDFGLSRLDDKTRTTSAEPLMTLGYCAPEYQLHGKMSAKSDIYSLGVIILEIVTGSKEKPAISKVLRRWKHRWNKSATGTLLAYKQVDECLDLAKRCMHPDPTVRPKIQELVSDLEKMDSTEQDISNGYANLEGMLRIEPLEMHLRVELNKLVSWSIELTNDTDCCFAFNISTTSLRHYDIHPAKDIVPPRSKRSVTITLQALKKAPPHNYRNDEFCVQSTTVDDSLTTMDISGGMFKEEAGNVVDNVNLNVVLDV